jgi:hypothetical protein
MRHSLRATLCICRVLALRAQEHQNRYTETLWSTKQKAGVVVGEEKVEMERGERGAWGGGNG